MKEPKERFARSLQTRSARLAKLVELNAPATVIANEVNLVRRAMYGLAPEEMAQAEMTWMAARVRNEAGFCATPECVNAVERGNALCAACDDADEIGPNAEDEKH